MINLISERKNLVTKVVQFKERNEIIDEKKLLHFFGAIIVQRMETDPTDTNRFEVIDGQQRLTTLFLFVMAGIFHLRIYDRDEAVKFFKRFLFSLEIRF